jgi:hypothetical protein
MQENASRRVVVLRIEASDSRSMPIARMRNELVYDKVLQDGVDV